MTLQQDNFHNFVPVTKGGQDILDDLVPENTRIHCIGVGGVGVSAIAEMLIARGFIVSGSDREANSLTAKLEHLGVEIFIGHKAEQVADADIIVYSSAINQSNPEYAAAMQEKKPLYRRAQMLAALTMHHKMVAVCGTHGKTTTTGMLVWVLHLAGLAPSFAVGGNLSNMNSYCQLTNGSYAVIEADESDATFLFYAPDLVILTNVDKDHLENYQGNYDLLKKTYARFLQQVADTGMVAVCADSDHAVAMIPEIKAKVLTYGESAGSDYRIIDFKQQGAKSYFTVQRPQRDPIHCQLNCPGLHNATNAAAVVLMADYLDVDDKYLTQALRSFSGMGRRFHRHGDIKLGAGSSLLVEDYGHHPRELEVTLQAARQVWPQRRLVLVFQPHRYSRVQHLWDDFVKVLSGVDCLLLMTIYPAAEQPIEGVTSQSLAININKLSPDLPVKLVSDSTQLAKVLDSVLQQDDLCLVSGAGSIGRTVLELKKDYSVS